MKTIKIYSRLDGLSLNNKIMSSISIVLIGRVHPVWSNLAKVDGYT